MADRSLLGVATTAKIAGHPIHPMLIPFPIALLVAAFASDIAYSLTFDAFWARSSFWSLVASVVMAAAAAAAGIADFLGNARIRSMTDAWQHMIGNLVAVTVAAANLVLRWTTGVESVLPVGIWLSGMVVVILVYTGWKGGSLVYHHRIGMQPQEPKN